MLAQLCRHIVRGRKVSQMADEMEKLRGTDAFDFEVYRQLLAEEEKQTRTIASLATRMRAASSRKRTSCSTISTRLLPTSAGRNVIASTSGNCSTGCARSS
jgi:hypothetical protein